MGYRVLNFINFVFTFYCCYLISLENFYNRVCYKQRWILFRRVNATTVYTNRANGAFRFVLLFLFLLPCLINASVSVCVYNFHCFLPQQSDGLWCASSTQIDCPNNAEIHTYLLVCESTDFWMYSSSHQYECVYVWVTRDSLIVFFVRFACVCVITCWSVVFASLLWVCLFAVKSHLHCN